MLLSSDGISQAFMHERQWTNYYYEEQHTRCLVPKQQQQQGINIRSVKTGLMSPNERCLILTILSLSDP